MREERWFVVRDIANGSCELKQKTELWVGEEYFFAREALWRFWVETPNKKLCACGKRQGEMVCAE